MAKSKFNDLRDSESDTIKSLIKLCAHSKLRIMFDGLEGYRNAAEQCFKRTIGTSISAGDIRSVRTIQAAEEPWGKINSFLINCAA